MYQNNDGDISHHPDCIDNESAAHEQDLGAMPWQVHWQSAGKVVKQVAVGDKYGDGTQDHNDGEESSYTSQDDDIGDESGDNEDEGVLAEIDKEEGEAEQSEQDTEEGEETERDFEAGHFETA